MNKESLRYTPSAFALALIIISVQQFWFKDFIAGRAPVWPEGLPGKTVSAYLTGLLFLATGIAVMWGQKSKPLLVVTGFTILLWAGLRNIAQILMHPEYGGLLTNTMKSLTIGSGAFIMANASRDTNGSQFTRVLPPLAALGRIFLGLFLLVGGVQHFIFADFVKFLIPSWIPGSLFWTYFAGVALILAGISLITRIQIKLSSLLAGIMIGIWLVVLHIPRAAEMRNQNEWTAVSEAMAVSCLLLTIYFQERKVESEIGHQALSLRG